MVAFGKFLTTVVKLGKPTTYNARYATGGGGYLIMVVGTNSVVCCSSRMGWRQQNSTRQIHFLMSATWQAPGLLWKVPAKGFERFYPKNEEGSGVAEKRREKGGSNDDSSYRGGNNEGREEGSSEKGVNRDSGSSMEEHSEERSSDSSDLGGDSNSSSSSSGTSNSSGVSSGGSSGRGGGGTGERKDTGRGMFFRFRSSKGLWIVSGLCGLLLLSFMEGAKIGKEVTFQEFLTDYLSKGHVEKLKVINKDVCKVFLRKPSHANQISGRIPTETMVVSPPGVFSTSYASSLQPLSDSLTSSSPVVSTGVTQPLAPPYSRIAFRIGSIRAFEERLEAYQRDLGIHPNDYIPIQYVNEFSLLNEVKGFMPSIVFFILFLFFLQKVQSKAAGSGSQVDRFFRMAKVNPLSAKDIKSKTKFSDVAGMVEAKKEIAEFVDFLKDTKKYEHLGARIPKGALLCGPPGTGKTLLARAVAGEANVPFFSISGSDFIEVFVGIGPSRVRDLFTQARKYAPSIVFIDEIDAVGRRRARGGFAGGANDERENTLNQILVEMDGFTSSTGVVVLAGTNRSDILDPALTRPGRFDRKVHIDKPDLEERQEIFKIHLKPLKLASGLDMEEVANRLSALTPGFAGAEISNVCNEAAINAARRDSLDGVDEEDFEKAAERVMGGLPKSGSLLSLTQKKIVAYHEAGHALVGWLLKHADPVLKVSIVPRSNGALGFSQQMPDDVMLFSKDALLDKMAVILGGRAAEEEFIGSISTGAADDLDKVTKMAYAFVSQWGMNPAVGLVSFQSKDKDDPQLYKPYSESTAQLIDAEVKRLITTQYERVKGLLKEKKDLVHKLSDLLFRKETISYSDIAGCVGERQFEMKEQFQKFVTASPRRKQIGLDMDNEKKPQDNLKELSTETPKNSDISEANESNACAHKLLENEDKKNGVSKCNDTKSECSTIDSDVIIAPLNENECQHELHNDTPTIDKIELHSIDQPNSQNVSSRDQTDASNGETTK